MAGQNKERSKIISNILILENDLNLINWISLAYKNGSRRERRPADYPVPGLLMPNPNMVLTKEQILDKLWDCDGNYIDSSTLTVYMRRLRIKIEDNPSEPQMLLTVRGMGYKWNVIG